MGYIAVIMIIGIIFISIIPIIPNTIIFKDEPQTYSSIFDYVSKRIMSLNNDISSSFAPEWICENGMITINGQIIDGETC